MRARDHIPDSSLALELANELAELLSSARIETGLGPIHNRPTCGFYRHKSQRIEAAIT